MEKETHICPYCGKRIKVHNRHHLHKCRLDYLSHLTEAEKEKYWDLYVKQELSVIQVSNIMNLPYSQIQKILPALGIKLRNIKEACNTPDRKRRYEETVMRHFGTPHNFCKECSSRKEWEKRLMDEEGICNVFQREDVKAKIKATMLERYGEDGVYYNRTKGSTLEYWIDKLGDELGRKRYKEINRTKAHTIEHYIELYGEVEGYNKYCEYLSHVNHFTHHDGLNKKAYKILEENGIEYEAEFRLRKKDGARYYYYDIKIGNLLIELNGIYWHCSPKRYQPHDIVRFPNNVTIVAQDKWASDKKKCEYAKELGYQIETIWEDDFSEQILLNIIKKHNYGIY